MRQTLFKMGFTTLLAFVTLSMFPTLVTMISDGDPGLAQPFEMLLRTTGLLKWFMLGISILSYAGLAIMFVLDGDFLPRTKIENKIESRQEIAPPSEKSILESKLQIIKKQIEKVNSHLGQNGLADDLRTSLLSALAFLSKQKSFIEFRFIALDQIEWEAKVQHLYQQMEKMPGTDETTINICREYLNEIATDCTDRLKQLDALETESVTDTPETSRAVRDLRERVEDIERITSENLRHLQTREIAGTLVEIKQLEAGGSGIESDFQTAIPVQFITGNIEPLDTELMFQMMRIESLTELTFSDVPDEKQS